jgi:hypothetical protein
MSKGWDFRLIVHRALLIALMIQGVTPDANTLVSPLVLNWLHPDVLTGSQDYHPRRMPDSDRSSPSNDTNQHGSPDEVAVSNESIARSVSNRRLTELPRFPSGSTELSLCAARCHPSLLSGSPRHNEPINDLILSLCKLTC